MPSAWVGNDVTWVISVRYHHQSRYRQRRIQHRETLCKACQSIFSVVPFISWSCSWWSTPCHTRRKSPQRDLVLRYSYIIRSSSVISIDYPIDTSQVMPLHNLLSYGRSAIYSSWNLSVSLNRPEGNTRPLRSNGRPSLGQTRSSILPPSRKQRRTIVITSNYL